MHITVSIRRLIFLQRGLEYVHSAGVVHGTLSPSNILINENLNLRICDFGLAHIEDPEIIDSVPTSYYVAPESALEGQTIGPGVDIWSVGCIFAEMFRRKPLFPAMTLGYYTSIVTDLVGTPPEDVVNAICNESVSGIVCSYLNILVTNYRLSLEFAPYEILAGEKTIPP